MAKLQIAMDESELKKIQEILIKASAKFQLQESKPFNYRTTIIRIVEEWAKNHDVSNKNNKKAKK